MILNTLLYLLMIAVSSLLLEVMASSSSTHSNNHQRSFRIPGRPYETTWDEAVDEAAEDDYTDRTMRVKGRSWQGAGREFDLFGSGPTRGGSDSGNILGQYPPTGNVASARNISTDGKFRRPSSPYSSNGFRSSRTSSEQRFSFTSKKRPKPELFQTVQDWWTTSISPNIQSWPRIQCRVEPTTTLKLRKTFRPLKTIVRLGADFNTQLGVWQFKSSWEDDIIGGKLTLAGKELQLTKSWQLSVGAVEDLVTRLRFRAAIDLQTWKAYARVGFRTERLSPINVMEGFTLMKRIPLDGSNGNVKLEVKANFALPEPELEYGTETQRGLVGMGDVEVSIDELNLVLDY